MRSRILHNAGKVSLAGAVVASGVAAGEMRAEISIEESLGTSTAMVAEAGEAYDSQEEAFATSPAVSIQPLLEWNEESLRRFDRLAEKYALGEISANEEEELEILQQLRRGALAPRTFEEISSDLELETFINDASSSLQRLIDRVRKQEIWRSPEA